jgi:hypothetical protein
VRVSYTYFVQEAKRWWPSLAAGILVLALFALPAGAGAHSPITDQVLITVLRDRVFAATPAEGLMRVDLLAGEEIQHTESKGVNALVQTSVSPCGPSCDSRFKNAGDSRRQTAGGD